MTVTSKEYYNDLGNFLNKHSKYDFKVYTSNFDNNCYHKEYCFENGATFCEINEMDFTTMVDVEVYGVTVKTQVNLIRHEYWSTDDSVSKYWYEAR